MASQISKEELREVVESPLGEELWYIRFLPTQKEEELTVGQTLEVMAKLAAAIRENRSVPEVDLDLLVHVDQYISDMHQHENKKVNRLKEYTLRLHEEIWNLLFTEVKFLFRFPK